MRVLQTQILSTLCLGQGIQFKDLLSMMGNFEIRYKQKAYTNNFFGCRSCATDDLSLGNDGVFYLVGFKSNKATWRVSFNSIKSAYVVTPSYLSDQLDYDVQYLYQGSNFNMGFGLMGIFSMKDHPFSENPTATP